MPTPGTVEFPTALDGVVSLFEVNNRAYTTLSADINNSVLAIPLTDSTVFPATGVVTLTDSLTAPTKHEEIIYTANAANSLTVPVGGRGAFGSTAQNWSGTVYVRMRMIAEHHEVVRDAVIQLETKVGYGAATPTDGKFLVGNTTAGTSTWRVLATGDIPDLSATYEPANANIQAHIASTSNPHSVTKSQVGLGNVENTALSTWAGSANLTTLGTIASGTWNGSVIGSNYGGAGSINGILKANGSGVVSAASAGTDYLGVTAPGSSGQLLYNNANAYAAVAGSVYSASADHSLKFTPTVSKAGLLIYEPTSTAPATVVGAPALLQLHTVNDTSYWQLSYSSDAINDVWANYLYSDGGIWFAHSNGVNSGYVILWRDGIASSSVSATYYGGIAEVASDQFGLMLTTTSPRSGAIFPLTWRATGITQAAPATALADGSVPVNHLHFYQDEATNELKAKWKESGGSVNTITFGSGGASNPFDDATAIIKGSADATKLLRIEVDGITTATTRVWTAPDANLTVAGIDLAQTFTAAQSFSNTIALTSTTAASNLITQGAAINIGTTSTDGIVLQNTTAAAAGAQQYSPRLRFTGQGWKTNATAASQTVDWAIETRPVQGAANPTSTLNFLTQVNAGGYTSRIQIGSAGTTGTLNLTVTDSASTPHITFNGETNAGISHSAGGQFGVMSAGTERLRISSVGLTVVGVYSLSTAAAATPGDTILSRAAAANWQLGNADAASPVSQTLSSQSVAAGATNTAGATWTLRASLGTGNAVPGRLHVAGGAVSATSGTAQQTAVDRAVFNATKVLTNNSAITITNVTVASNSNAGGQIGYLIEVTDGTDFQYETGVVSFGVTNKGGVFSGNTCTKFGNHQNATAGTLTVTFAISGANPALLSCNANSSLTPSTGFPRITYWLMNEAQQAIAIQ